MLRAVFDTNIYVSALLFDGAPEKLIITGFERRFLLFISDEILAELTGVLIKKFNFSSQQIKKVKYLIESFTIKVFPRKTVTLIKNWPADNRILECCLEAKADFLVSGDKKHLLSLKKFKNSKIVTAQEFLKIITEHLPIRLARGQRKVYG